MDVWRSLDRGAHPSGDRLSRIAVDRHEKIEQARILRNTNRGILRLRRNQVDEAIADFDQAIAIDPDQPEAYVNKGAALIRRENPQEALQLFTAAIELTTASTNMIAAGMPHSLETCVNALCVSCQLPTLPAVTDSLPSKFEN